MAYIGRQPKAGRFDKIDDISGSFNGSTTSFNLRINNALINVGRAEQLLISVGGVIQEPVTDYTISSYNTIEFTTAPESSDSFFGILLGDTFQAHTPMNNSVTGAALASTILASGKTFKNLTLADSLSVTANTTVSAPLTVASGTSNTNIFSDHLNITANTVINGIEPIGTGKAVAMAIVFGG